MTEGFRLWSLDTGDPFTTFVLFTMVGTAGKTEPLLFTDDMEVLWPCCAGAELPTATAGDEPAVLDAIGGEKGFLVAFAYDRAVAEAGAAARGDVVPPIEVLLDCAVPEFCVAVAVLGA